MDSIQTANLPNIGAYIIANEVNLARPFRRFRSVSTTELVAICSTPSVPPCAMTSPTNGKRTSTTSRNTFIGDCYNEFQERRTPHATARDDGKLYFGGHLFYSVALVFSLQSLLKRKTARRRRFAINRDENWHLWLFRNIITELQRSSRSYSPPRAYSSAARDDAEGVEQEIGWGIM